MNDPRQVIVAHLREFIDALGEETRPLHEVALRVFLQREENYLTMLSLDEHYMEERFLNFLTCPSTYDMVMEAVKMDEDACANAAGLGGVAGIGVGPKGEPGFKLPRKKKIDEATCAHNWHYVDMGNVNDPNRRAFCTKCGAKSTRRGIEQGKKLATGKRIADVRWTYARGYEDGKADKAKGVQADIPFNAPHLMKRTQEEWGRGYRDGWNGNPMNEEVKPKETFAGADVFEVDTAQLMKSRFGKNRYHRYSRYVGMDETGEAIRQHGRTTKRDIVLKDQTGTMVFLRRKGLPPQV